jgi:hypothetical protein
MGELFLVVGTILLLGVIFKWKFLVDSPEYLWPFYSQSLIKKFCGKEFLILETILLGILFLCIGGRMIWQNW